jgi:branched-subunit amino acid transport protein
MIWAIIIGMSIVTYGTRLLPLTTIREEMLPPRIRQGLTYVPVAVLSAIIAPEFIPSDGWFNYQVDAHLLAGVVAIGIAWYTRSTVFTIVAGMAVLLIVTELTR